MDLWILLFFLTFSYLWNIIFMTIFIIFMTIYNLQKVTRSSLSELGMTDPCKSLFYLLLLIALSLLLEYICPTGRECSHETFVDPLNNLSLCINWDNLVSLLNDINLEKKSPLRNRRGSKAMNGNEIERLTRERKQCSLALPYIGCSLHQLMDDI